MHFLGARPFNSKVAGHRLYATSHLIRGGAPTKHPPNTINNKFLRSAAILPESRSQSVALRTFAFGGFGLPESVMAAVSKPCDFMCGACLTSPDPVNPSVVIRWRYVDRWDSSGAAVFLV